MAMICGIDEAGRGPVIGPMVMAGVLVNDKDIAKLKNLGVKDSKLIVPRQREELYYQIIRTVKKYKIIIVNPKEIDDALESVELNLNWLEAYKAAEIINFLKPDKAIVDSPSNNCKAYGDYLMNLLDNKKVELNCMHKADVKHVEVGAASILAKVTRDKEIVKIQEKYGNCGPGYPSNEVTQKFLAENWDKYPEIFRKTWASYKNVKKRKGQKSLGEFSNN